MIAYPDDTRLAVRRARDEGGLQRLEHEARELIARHPLVSVGAAAVTGYVLARVIAWAVKR